MATKTAATPENGKEKKPRGRRPRTAKANTETTTGAQARSSQRANPIDLEGAAIQTVLSALEPLDQKGRELVMGYASLRYDISSRNIFETGNTEQRSMAAGA